VHTGSPVLDDCLAWFDCEVHERVDAGDHQVVIGKVAAFGVAPNVLYDTPLAYSRGRYARLHAAPANAMDSAQTARKA